MGCCCFKKKKTNKAYIIEEEEKNKGEELSTTAGPYSNSLLENKNLGNEQSKEGLNTKEESETIKINIGGNDQENEQEGEELNSRKGTEKSEIKMENEQGEKLRKTTGSYNIMNSRSKNKNKLNEENEKRANTNRELKEIEINMENNGQEYDQDKNELNTNEGIKKNESKIENEQGNKLSNNTGSFNTINNLFKNNDNENEQSEKGLNTNKESEDIKINLENNEEENKQEVEELSSNNNKENEQGKLSIKNRRSNNNQKTNLIDNEIKVDEQDEKELYITEGTKKSKITNLIEKNNNKGKDPAKSKGPSRNDYEVIEHLDSGSFGDVYLVRLKPTHELFAMKIIKKENLKKKAVEKAMNELKIWIKVKSDFVANIKQAFHDKEKLYLISEFAPGGDLFRLFEQNNFEFSLEWIRFYIAELVVALEDLHSKNIIHRDIKPENILIDSEGHIKLTDFGISRILEKNEKAKTMVGTYSYMAPEIIDGNPYDKTVDWWSVGCVMYSLLEAAFVFKNIEDAWYKIRNNCFNLKFKSTKNLDAKDLVNKFLRLDPEKRLGAGEDGINEIKKHPFFKDIDWDLVKKRKLTPPFVPKKENYENKKKNVKAGLIDNTDNDFEDEDYRGFSFTAESFKENSGNLIDENKDK